MCSISRCGHRSYTLFRPGAHRPAAASACKLCDASGGAGLVPGCDAEMKKGGKRSRSPGPRSTPERTVARMRRNRAHRRQQRPRAVLQTAACAAHRSDRARTPRARFDAGGGVRAAAMMMMMAMADLLFDVTPCRGTSQQRSLESKLTSD